MENRFSNRDFEQFVKQNADQYRMYPSEKVWKNIHYSLHTRRKWYGFGLALLLLTTGAVTWLMLGTGKKEQTIAYKPAAILEKATANAPEKPAPKIFVARPNSNERNTVALLSNAQNLNDKIFVTEVINEEENSNEYLVASITPPAEQPQITSSFQAPDLTTKAPVVAIKRNSPGRLAIASKPAEKNTNSFGISETKVAATSTPAENNIIKEDKKDIYPMTIESVVNDYKHAKSKKKIAWEVYFSPTISYRSLKENKAFINSTLANTNSLNYYTAISDINSLVTHKPDIGLQMGFAAGYPLTKNLRIKAGMQFNVSKYDIRAYTYNSEVATIALNTGAAGANSVSTITNYRNFSGDNASWLRNLYISASLPVGLELKLNRTGKKEFGVAATLQPTYMLGDRVYLLSTDYKNYAEVPSLTRKWNFSGGLEVYAGINTGKVQWRVGPHVRYQMLSSFDATYPVKEHLFDFGLKVGLMLKKY